MSANYGRAFVYGDGINTDMLAPGIYMKHQIATIATHCLESVDPDFARTVRPGDVMVAGRGFGIGSSREQAAEALKHLGVAAVLARSYGGIFYRNALNFGLPVLVCSEVDRIAAGDLVRVDAATGTVHNKTRGTNAAVAYGSDVAAVFEAALGRAPQSRVRHRASKRP